MSWSAAPPPNPYVVRAFEDPAVAAAHAAGRRHQVYELLVAKRNASHDPAERAALDELVRYRRNFVERGTPGGMGSVNGVGVKLYGQEELDPRDGSFIATLYLIVLFIPVFPLGEYLVQRGSSGFIRSTWQFWGKVPMSSGHRLWRKGAVALGGAGAVGLIALGSLAAYAKRQSADVWVTNDLDIEVEVTLGHSNLRLTGHTQSVVRKVPKGVQHVVVKREDGRVLEEEDVTIKGGADATVVNVLGASPIFEEKIFYATNGKAPDSEAQVFVGQRFIVRDSVDYVFTEPPKTISMEQSSSAISKTHVGRAPEGIEVTIGYLVKESPTGVAAFVEGIALAEPESEKMTSRALDMIEKPEDQLTFLEKVLAFRPDDAELHRKRQSLLITLGRGADALAEYKARYEKEPSSIANAYLYAAVLPRQAARELLEKVSREVPKAADDLYVVRLLGAIAYQERRFDDAVPLLERVAKSPHHHQAVISEHAGSLLATRGPLAALRMLKTLAPEEQKAPAYWIVYGQVVARGRAQHAEGADTLDPAAPVAPATLPEDWATLYADWGLEPPKKLVFDVATKSALEIDLAARRDPDRALELFDHAAPQARSKVLSAVALAIAIEAGRRGNQALAHAAYGVAEQGYGVNPALEAFAIEGRDDPTFDGEQMALRALVELGRARREKDKKKRAELEGRARVDDPLFGLVSDALDAWPTP